MVKRDVTCLVAAVACGLTAAFSMDVSAWTRAAPTLSSQLEGKGK